jgi:HPt (histidine-containing phosphotransfer) domain-containing protein
MTAHALEGEREKCLAAGMDDYISKPVKIETLGETLKKWFVEIEEKHSETKTEKFNPANNAGEDESIDAEVHDNLRCLQTPGEPDILTELIDLFLADAGARMSILKQAAASGDAKTIRDEAHAIKGGGGNIGAAKLTRLANRLETCAGDIVESRFIVSEMEAEFEKVSSILKTT